MLNLLESTIRQMFLPCVAIVFLFGGGSALGQVDLELEIVGRPTYIRSEGALAVSARGGWLEPRSSGDPSSLPGG